MRTGRPAETLAEPARQRRADPRGHVIHDVGGAGPIYAAAVGPEGRRYFSDEHRHRVVVEETTGYRWSFGGLGSGAGEFRHPRGLALLPGRTSADSRLFVCDAWNHRVQVFDGNGRFCLAFGGQGAKEGQFDVPSDVVLMRPVFPGEDLDESDGGWWLAVADRWNNRVQVFEIDGGFVGAIGGSRRSSAARPVPEGAGWPFFRVGVDPTLWFPVRLGWRDDRLEITSANGHRLKVDVRAALLPDFDTWRRASTLPELEDVRESLAGGGDRWKLPPDILAAIATEIGRHQVAAGRWRHAAGTWGAPWPAGLPAAKVERELRVRVDALIPNIPRRRPPACATVVERVESCLDAERLAAARLAAEEHLDEPTGELFVPGIDPGSNGHGADGHAAALARYAALAARFPVGPRRGVPEAHVAWSAPTAAGHLRHLAVGHGVLALVAGKEPAVWLFDGRCNPIERFSLPAGTCPYGIAPAPGRGWYVTDLQHDCVFQLNADGKIARVWGGRGAASSRLCAPLGLAEVGGRLLVADRGNDRLEVFDVIGHRLAGYRRLGAPTAAAGDGATAWIAEWRARRLRRIDMRTGRVLAECRHQDLVSPVSLAISGPLVLAADHYGAAVHAFDRRGRWHGRLSRADRRPMGRLCGIAVIRGGGVVVDGDRGQLLRFALPRRPNAWQHR